MLECMMTFYVLECMLRGSILQPLISEQCFKSVGNIVLVRLFLTSA
jgi:hypothetical protein